MKKVVSSSATNVFYALRSVKFWTAVAVNMLILFIFADVDILWGQNESIHYILFLTLDKIPEEFTMAVSAVPAVTLFADEWCSGRFIYSYTRLKGVGYAVTLVISVFLISMLVSFISTGLYIGILSLSHPWLGDTTSRMFLQSASKYANGGWLQHGHYFAFYLVTLLRQACYMGIFSAMAAVFSIWISNSYVAIVFPVFLNSVIMNILTPLLKIPFVLVPKQVYLHYVYLAKIFDPDLNRSENNFTVISMLYPFIYTLIILALLAVLSYFWIIRKYRSSSDMR